MEWLQCKVITTTEGTDTIGNLLIEQGVQGFQIEDKTDLQNFLNSDESKNWDYVDGDLLKGDTDGVSTLTFYLSQNPYGHDVLMSVKTRLEEVKNMDLGIEVGSLKLTTEDVDEEDWINNWKKYYKPFKIGESVVVRPVWEQYDKKNNEVVFVINPGHIFGTGLHHTTKLCVEALEDYVKKDSEILDLGCGSGILSVISLLLGGKNALAIDIDKNAINIAYENATLNGIGKDIYTVKSGDVLKDEKLKNEVSKKKYDLIIANIVADVIIGIKDFVKDTIKEEGIFIASGIIEERTDEVVMELKKSGYEIIKINNKEGWVSIVSRKGKV